MSGENSIQVTGANFEADVIGKSGTVPVLVDFYADWCGPCKSLAPTLEKLANEYAGAFILAKVDSDAEQMLVSSMGVRSLPTVVLFKDGQPVDHFMGVLPEGEIRQILEKHVEKKEASPLERARSLAAEGNFSESIALYQLVTADEPENTDVILEMATCYLSSGDGETAENLVLQLSEALQMDPRAKKILANRVFLEVLKDAPTRIDCIERIEKDKSDLEAFYFLAAFFMIDDEVDKAIDALITVIKMDREFLKGDAKKLLITIFDRLGAEDPRSRAGRRQLASILLV